MSSMDNIKVFFEQKNIAVVGVSRNGKKFGNVVFKDLLARGYNVFAINKSGETINGEKSYVDLNSVPEKLDGLVTVVPPAETVNVIKEAAAVGINHVWMQQGSESEDAILLCQENNIKEVHGQCIMMYAEPVENFHAFHRWLWKIFGKLPKPD
jgi:uncharacterized protein